MAEENYSREIPLGNGNVFKTNITDALLNSIVLYLPLDWNEANKVIDHSSYQLDATSVIHPATWETSSFPTAGNVMNKSVMYFDGANTYLNIDHLIDKIGNSSFTYSVWIKCSTFSGGKALFAINSASGSKNYVAFINLSMGHGVTHHLGNRLYLPPLPVGADRVIANQWHHVAITYNNDNKKIETFINAHLASSVTVDNIIAIANDVHIQIGANNSGSNSTNYFKGSMSQFAVFNRELTQQEIQLIKNEDLKYALNQPPYPDFPASIRKNSRQQAVYNITDALSKIEQLSGVRFKWKREDNPQYDFSDSYQLGFIIEELANVFPDLVKDNNNTDLTIALSGLIALIIEAIKVLKQESDNIVTDLANKVNALEADQQAKIADLQQRLANINSIAYE